MEPFSGGIPIRYDGDETFARLLADSACPMPLHQVKTLLLGAGAATEFVLPSAMLEALWGDKTPEFRSDEEFRNVLSNLVGLYNQLIQHTAEEPYRLTRVPSESVEDLVRYVRVRQEEIAGFLRGLDLGDTDPDELSEVARGSLVTLAEASAFYKRYEELAAAGEVPREAPLDRTFAALGMLDRVVELSFIMIDSEQRRARLAWVESLREQVQPPHRPRHHRAKAKHKRRERR